MNPFRMYAVGAAALGCVLFGFNTAVIAGVTRALAGAFGLSPGLLGLTVSSGLWGALLGAALAFRCAGHIGRRMPFLALAIVSVLSAAGCGLAWNWQSFAVFRLVGGIALGAISVLGALYIAEIAPDALRGKLAVLFYLSVTLGAALAYYTNYLVGRYVSGPDAWRWKLGVACGLAYLLFFAVLPIPECASWLLRGGRSREAREILVSLGERDVEARMKDFAVRQSEKAEPHLADLFRDANRPRVLLAIAISALSQLVGMAAILCYLNDLFAWVGFSEPASHLQAVVIGLASLMATMIMMKLVAQVELKQLLLGGACGLAATLVAMATVLHSREFGNMLPLLLTMLVIFVAASQGVAVWVYVCELLPGAFRVQGLAFNLLVSLSVSAVVSGLYPVVMALGAGIPFFFFALMTAVEFVVVLLVLPESVCPPIVGARHEPCAGGPALQP